MINFALEEISEISGRIKIFKLFVNGMCYFDEFEKEIAQEGNLISELRTIVTRLHEIADGKLLPELKFRDITPKNEKNKEYEIKTRHLRVYIFHESKTGRIIVSGGKKGTQKTDIKRFRKIKNEYCKQRP
jgi:putative component of toxin-antitoxin plasmid stabilization module